LGKYELILAVFEKTGESFAVYCLAHMNLYESWFFPQFVE